MPDFTVSCDGEVQSIILASKVPIEELASGIINAARWEQFRPEDLKLYFETLKFGFSERQKEGLMEYYQFPGSWGEPRLMLPAVWQRA